MAKDHSHVVIETRENCREFVHDPFIVELCVMEEAITMVPSISAVRNVVGWMLLIARYLTHTRWLLKLNTLRSS